MRKSERGYAKPQAALGSFKEERFASKTRCVEKGMNLGICISRWEKKRAM